MILWSSFQPCQDLGPGGSERRAVGAQVMIITMLMFSVFMTLMMVVVEMTRGVRKESSWGQGDGDYPGFVACNLINSSLFVGFPNCFEKYEIDVCSELGGCEGAGHPKSRRRRRTLDPGGAQRWGNIVFLHAGFSVDPPPPQFQYWDENCQRANLMHP